MTKTRRITEGERTDLRRDLNGLDEREQLFCLYVLGSKMPKWSAKKAGYRGDIAKRARTLMARDTIQAFLAKFAPPPNAGRIEISKEGLLKKLAQIASGQLVKINTSDVLKAVELIGKNLGMWEGTSQEGRDRLKEILSVFAAGPVEKEAEKNEQS
jgi:hypothetical protein